MVISNKCGNSDWLETNLGVPQGSVLGPLLFSLYVNDLRDRLDRHTIRHIFYADDLQIYLHTTKDKILEGMAQLSDAARMVAEWAETSGLHLNSAKTKAILIGSSKGVNYVDSLGLQGIGLHSGVLVPFSSEVVSLGITLDSKLT